MKKKLLKIGFIGSLFSFNTGKAAYISQRSINLNNNLFDSESSIRNSEILASELALKELLLNLINDKRYENAEEEEWRAVHPASYFPDQKQ